MTANHEQFDGPMVQTAQDERAADEHRYTMRISRKTVDKLGVKLYDRASAVVAELVANAYDADAESVRVRLPLAKLLGSPEQGATDPELIEVRDDGHGMNPAEADQHFLVVGQDRRANDDQGAFSRWKKRPVMGRKGIGKLAPFGICRRIEVVSAGGERTEEGYLTSHFTLDYREIIQDTEVSYHPERGPRDRTYSAESGTTIRLSRFQRKRVPDQETFLRQLARRFGAEQPGFEILVENARADKKEEPARVTSIAIPVAEETRIDVAQRPILMEDGVQLAVKGWVGMAQQGYKHEELAGIRIYARHKIVASTRDFGLMSGFTGENTLRSYLVGEIYAEWLDEDTGEDLIKTDRQDILWESDRGLALRSWGQDLLREIGTRSRAPRRDNVRKLFMKAARMEERATERYTDEAIVATAMDLASVIGGFAAEDELTDQEYINGLCDIILSVAPHQALMDAFRRFHEEVNPGSSSLESLLELFGKTRVAELASYSQIAAERVAAIGELKNALKRGATELELQRLINSAPWLIEPTWSVVTKNESIKTFADQFEAHWLEVHGQEISVTLVHSNKRPDFIAMEVGSRLRAVELKAPKHHLDVKDFKRLQNYVEALRHLFANNATIKEAFARGWQIDLVADGVAQLETSDRESFSRYQERKEVARTNWTDFLTRADRAHRGFMLVRETSDRLARELGPEQVASDE